MIIISNIISFILIAYIANSFLTLKYSKNINIVVLLISIIIISLINFNGASPIKSIILLCIYFIYVFTQYNGKVIQKIITIIPYFLIQIIAEIIVAFFLNNIFSISITNDPSSSGFILGTILSYVVLSLFVFAYVKILKYIKTENLPKYTWFAFILPIITILLLVSMGNYFELLQKNSKVLITVVGLAICNIIFFFVFILAINATNIKNKLQITEQREKLINSKFDLLSQHYDYNFKFLHDLLHTCNELNTLFEESKYIEASHVLNELSNTAYKEFNAIYSNSYILNYVINNNLNKIVEYNIDVKTVIEYGDFNGLDYQTQLLLFDYLINISLESCINAIDIERIIIVKAVKTGNKIILKMTFTNSSIDKLGIENNLRKILIDQEYSLNVKRLDRDHVSILLSFIVK